MITNRPTLHFRPARFALVFAAAYVLLHCIYFALPDALLRDWVHYYEIVLPAAGMINLLAPDEAVSAMHGTLQSASASLSIVRGCDGSGFAFLLVAAVLASSARLKDRLLGLASAALLAYVLNQLRLVGLYFVAAHRAAWFEPLHGYFIPTLTILAGTVFFFCWDARARSARASRAP